MHGYCSSLCCLQVMPSLTMRVSRREDYMGDKCSVEGAGPPPIISAATATGLACSERAARDVHTEQAQADNLQRRKNAEVSLSRCARWRELHGGVRHV